MKLWILEARVDELPDNDNPWKPWYDKMFGYVVRAMTEDEAREIADENAGDENNEIRAIKNPWKDSKYSSCIELTPDGECGLVLSDFQSA